MYQKRYRNDCRGGERGGGRGVRAVVSPPRNTTGVAELGPAPASLCPGPPSVRVLTHVISEDDSKFPDLVLDVDGGDPETGFKHGTWPQTPNWAQGLRASERGVRLH